MWKFKVYICMVSWDLEPWASILFYIKVGKKNIKCTLVLALRLCTGPTAHRGSRGISLLFRDRGTRSGWGVRVTPWPLFTPGKDPVPIVHEVGWAPGPVWTGAEKMSPPLGFDPWNVQPVVTLPGPPIIKCIYIKIDVIGYIK